MVLRLEDRLDRLAAGRGPAAADRIHFLLHDEAFRLAGERRPIRAAVRHHRLDGTAKNTAALVDLIEGEQNGIDHGCFTGRHGAAQGMEHADLDRFAAGRHAGACPRKVGGALPWPPKGQGEPGKCDQE